MLKVVDVIGTILDAVADGKITPDEARDIFESLGSALPLDEWLDKAADAIADASYRDADELIASAEKHRARAAELREKGKLRRAARLDRKAARLDEKAADRLGLEE